MDAVEYARPHTYTNIIQIFFSYEILVILLFLIRFSLHHVIFFAFESQQEQLFVRRERVCIFDFVDKICVVVRGA